MSNPIRTPGRLKDQNGVILDEKHWLIKIAARRAYERGRVAERAFNANVVAVARELVAAWDISPCNAGDGLEASFYDHMAELRDLLRGKAPP